MSKKRENEHCHPGVYFCIQHLCEVPYIETEKSCRCLCMCVHVCMHMHICEL